LTLTPGFCVEHGLREAMLKCLKDMLHVDPERAKVLPVCDVDSRKLGRRLSSHPLADTYIGPEYRNRCDQFYEHTIRGSVVADLESIDDRRERNRRESLDEKVVVESLRRTLHVCTTPLDQLLATWHGFAADRHRDDHDPDQHEVMDQESEEDGQNCRHDMPE
jgi:hypothetical protein